MSGRRPEPRSAPDSPADDAADDVPGTPDDRDVTDEAGGSPHAERSTSAEQAAELAAGLEQVETFLLGEAPHLTRAEVSERAGVPLDLAEQLWRLMGFAHAADDEKAFSEADVEALRLSHDLIDLGILSPERQAALVRTWGRSFARLAEWQTSLLATVALEKGQADDPSAALAQLTGEVLPRVETLQSYVWRRHLVNAGARLLMVPDPTSPTAPTAVCFVDIVGYTSRSKNLSETDLVDWLEGFESETLDLVVNHGGRIIKNIGDEVLFVADDVVGAVETALEMTRRGADDDDPFPAVRAGVAYGEVVHRLGDVFGATVNVASRLTSAARPDSVLVDRGAYAALTGRGEDDEAPSEPPASAADYSFKRLRRLSVKGYSRLAAWSVRRH